MLIENILTFPEIASFCVFTWSIIIFWATCMCVVATQFNAGQPALYWAESNCSGWKTVASFSLWSRMHGQHQNQLSGQLQKVLGDQLWNPLGGLKKTNLLAWINICLLVVRTILTRISDHKVVRNLIIMCCCRPPTLDSIIFVSFIKENKILTGCSKRWNNTRLSSLSFLLRVFLHWKLFSKNILPSSQPPKD